RFGRDDQLVISRASGRAVELRHERPVESHVAGTRENSRTSWWAARVNRATAGNGNVANTARPTQYTAVVYGDRATRLRSVDDQRAAIVRGKIVARLRAVHYESTASVHPVRVARPSAANHETASIDCGHARVGVVSGKPK